MNDPLWETNALPRPIAAIYTKTKQPRSRLSRDGYPMKGGSPTHFMVKFEDSNRWYRVYAIGPVTVAVKRSGRVLVVSATTICRLAGHYQ